MELLEALVVLFLCAVALGWAAHQMRVPSARGDCLR
jgi:hypothetical protein